MQIIAKYDQYKSTDSNFINSLMAYFTRDQGVKPSKLNIFDALFVLKKSNCLR